MKRVLTLCMLAACAPAPDPAAMRALLDAEQVARLDVPVVFLTSPQADLATTLIPIALSGPVRTWQSRDDIQVVDRAGILVATRGLGHDLMAADIAGLQAALSGGPAQYARTWVHVDGQLNRVHRSAHCRLTVQGRQTHHAPLQAVAVTVLAEVCGAGNPVTNTYHIADDGLMWWSRQWVSDQIGMVVSERIAR